MLSLYSFIFSLTFFLKLQKISAATTTTQPNVILFLIDDQDVVLNSLDAFSKTQKIFGESGLQFLNGFVSTPVCCVSRSSILTGRYVHNHVTLNNTFEGNCYSKTWIDEEESKTFAAYLKQNTDYKVYYSGKYLNNYGKGTDEEGLSYKNVPTGYDEWYTLVGDSQFYGYSLSNNGELETHEYDYSTDYFPLLQKNHALTWLRTYATSSPFVMTIATPAAHKPWQSEPQYQSYASDKTLQAPRTTSFNYAGKEADYNLDKNIVVQSFSKMNQALINEADLIYRMRYASLLSVDDMIDEVYSLVDELGLLDNTYFIYTSDNGFHVGQFGTTGGKRFLYETDLRVPFFITGPNVKKGGVTSVTALNIDIAPTILELTLGYVPDNMDGRSLTSYFDLSEEEEAAIAESKQTFLVEYNGETNIYVNDGTPFNEKIMTCETQVLGLTDMNCDGWNNTYRCVRVIDGTKQVVDDEDTTSVSNFENDLSSYVKGDIYCKFTCFDNNYIETDCLSTSTEKYGEYYDLDYDFWQVKNQMDQLTTDEKNSYLTLIDTFLECSGQESCNTLRQTEGEYPSMHTIKRKQSLFYEQIETIHSIQKSSYILVGLVLTISLIIMYYLYHKCFRSSMKHAGGYQPLINGQTQHPYYS